MALAGAVAGCRGIAGESVIVESRYYLQVDARCEISRNHHLQGMDHALARLGLIDDDDVVLDEAALSLALLDHPATDLGPYHGLLEAVATRLATVGSDAVTAHDQADALSSVLNDEFGFVGDRDTYDDPANADLIQVIDRRRGLPVSLSILYVAAARRLGWTANVLDVPGHVLILVGGEDDPVIVDPFRGGVLVQREQLASFLVADNAGSRSAVRHVAAMPNRAVLVRLLLNQATRAEQAGNGRRALVLYRRMTVMAPDYGHAWWERARLELVDGDVEGARTSLAAMLEVTRKPELRRRIADTYAKLAAG